VSRLSAEHPALASQCTGCNTELAPELLSCPMCRALVHASALKELAALANRHAEAERLAEGYAAWEQALTLLPATSEQYRAVGDRMQELAARMAAAASSSGRRGPKTDHPWYRRGAGLLATIVIFAVTKAKFLILGLTKASTFVSMFAFFAVYWQAFGWALAAGLVISIYIHEMGHVAELRRLGIGAGAPLFIPGIGAIVMLKQRIDDPKVDARIGLAGPIYGLGAGLAAYAVHRATGNQLWGAIAQLTGLLNLFNLIPIWQLDGARGFHALSAWQRWVIVGVAVVAYLASKQGLLLLIAGVAVWRAAQRGATVPDMRALVLFAMLIGALTWLWTIPVDTAIIIP
jgi:Zn-dependent protease